MCGKLTFTKTLCVKITIEEVKAMAQYGKCQFCTQRRPKNSISHKIWKN